MLRQWWAGAGSRWLWGPLAAFSGTDIVKNEMICVDYEVSSTQTNAPTSQFPDDLAAFHSDHVPGATCIYGVCVAGAWTLAGSCASGPGSMHVSTCRQRVGHIHHRDGPPRQGAA